MGQEENQVESVTLEVLRGIQADLRELKADMGTVKSDLSAVKSDLWAVKSDLSAVKSEMNSRFELVDSRFAQMHEDLVGVLREMNLEMQAGFRAILEQGDRRYFDHEGRLRLVEARVGLRRPGW